MFPKGIHGASTPAHLVSQVTAELLTLTVPLNEVGTGHREPPHKGRSRERTQPSGSPAEHSPCDSVKPACSPCPSPLVPETPRQMMQEPVDRGGSLRGLLLGFSALSFLPRTLPAFRRGPGKRNANRLVSPTLRCALVRGRVERVSWSRASRGSGSPVSTQHM